MYQSGTQTTLLNTAPDGNFTFDKCPAYFSPLRFPKSAADARAVLPSARIIATVCDPVDRLWSQFHYNLVREFHRRAKDTFEELIEYLIPEKSPPEEYPSVPRVPPDVELLAWYTYIEQGLYVNGITPWAKAYGRDGVHVIHLPDLSKDNMALREETITRMLEFVGLPPERYDWDGDRMAMMAGRVHNKNDMVKGYCRTCIPSHYRERLKRVFRRANQDFAKYLNVTYPLEDWER